VSIKGNNNQGEIKYSKKIHVEKNDIDKEKKIVNNNQLKNKVNNNEIVNKKKIPINKEKKNIDSQKNSNQKEVNEGNHDIIKEIKNKNEIKINDNKNINEIQKLVPEDLEHNMKNKQKKYTSTYNRQIKETEEINSEKSMQELSKPGLIGLSNIGSICYMNATLQCFSNCSRFKCNLLKLYKELESNKDSKYRLSFSLAEVLRNLWEILNHKAYAPDIFKNIISELNPIFKDKSSKEPKDLVLFMIQKIHNELNKPNPDIKVNNNYDSHDFMSEYNSFMSFYKSQNNSIITDEFHFYINNMTTCSNCNTTIHNVQTNNTLLFPLEEVRKFKKYDGNYVSIYDCFEYNERQTNSDSYYCNNCNNEIIAYSMTKIVLSSKTLIINADRGYGMQYPIKIVFEEYLNIRKFVYNQDSPYFYELTGVICHLDSNDEGGHFIAYCKNCDDCNWYKFDDGIITKCSFSDVCQDGIHCLLFYSYIQMEE
jgi:ubiquitin C-terminal hydrolase